MDLDFIRTRFEHSASLKRKTFQQNGELILQAGQTILRALRAGGKVLFCGNGGSAADAQHMAAELVVKLREPRRPLPAIALTTDSSVLTAIANDFSFEDLFSRQVEALGRQGDVLIGNSTSGNSLNICRAFEAARGLGIRTVGLLGRDGGRIAGLADHPVIVPDSDTQRIQECHLLIAHVWMEMVDANIDLLT